MTTTISLDTALLGRTVSLGAKRYRLLEPLGSGATAVVFLGEEESDGEGNQIRHYAVKLTTEKENAEKERDNLLKLNAAQSGASRHHFPELYYPKDEYEKLEKEFFMGSGEWLTSYILLQELAPGIGAHDLLLKFPPTLSLPEPLALEIARQYAEMLSMAHKAGITSWDRKLSDLRWKWKADPPPSKDTLLVEWRKGELGNLEVIDWNVTHEATRGRDGTIVKDTFRFGLLWHRMLLGVEPQFQKGNTWRLLEPLESHAAWSTLSYGVQMILGRLLHPVPGERYLDTAQLTDDLGKVIRAWKLPSDQLADNILPVYENTQNSSRDAIQVALALASVLASRHDMFGEGDASSVQSVLVDKIIRALQNALSVISDSELTKALSTGSWRAALDRVGVLFRNVQNPVDLLLASRYRFVINVASDANWGKSDFIDKLIKYSNAIYEYDRSEKDYKRKWQFSEDVKKWKTDIPPITASLEWKEARDALVAAAQCRIKLFDAKQAYIDAEYWDAEGFIKEAITLRDSVSVIDKDQQLGWLDSIFYDPRPLYEDVLGRLKEEQRKQIVIKQGLGAILSAAQHASDEDSSIEKSQAALKAFLRQAPHDEITGRLLRLLDEWRRYIRLAPDMLAQRIMALSRVEEAWNAVKLNDLGDDSDEISLPEGIIDRFVAEWRSLGDEIMQEFPISEKETGYLKSYDTKAEAEEGWRIGLLCKLYHNNNRDDEFQQRVEHYLQFRARKIRELLGELDGTKYEFDNNLADKAESLSRLGYDLFRAWNDGGSWEKDIMPDVVEERLKKLRNEAKERCYWRLVYETAVSSPAPIGMEAS